VKLVIFSIKKTSLSDKFFLDFSRQYKLWQDKEKEIEQSVKTIVFYVIFVIIEKDGIKNWRHKIMKKRKILAMLMVAALSAGMLAGCGSDNTKEESKSTEAADTKENTEENKDTEETKEESTEESADQSEGTEEEVSGFTDGSGDGEDTDTADDTSTVLDTSEPLTGLHHAEIEVKDYGTIKVELDADTAPISVTNFVKLAQEHFYDGLTFHRIIDGFMIQGGDPEGTGRGGSDETIKGEFSENGVKNDISHERGVISMARSSDPDSASSQFFIVQSDSTYLDGQYAAFGHVTEGMDIVDQICKDAKPTDNNGTISADEQPVMTSVTIID
jgi:cyclophilin family peptidyl-prolyl cis-trans isomerase